MTDGSAPLDQDLGWMLGVVFRAYVTATGEALRDIPGGPRGYQVLTAACDGHPRNQAAIAADLGIDRTVMTYLVDDLETRELITRRPDPADRRSRLIVATAAGRSEQQDRRNALHQVEAHVLAPLSTDEATTLRRLLRAVACRAQHIDPVTDLCAVAEQA